MGGNKTQKKWEYFYVVYIEEILQLRKELFITEIHNSNETALVYTSHVILTGDFNTDFSNLTNSQLRDCMSIFTLRNVI